MNAGMNRQEALALLRQYNSEPFHLQHAFTVEAVMRILARELGQGDEDFWATVGLLHDVDFEKWPEEHCKKAPELLAPAGATEELIHAVVCHGYGLCSDVEPGAGDGEGPLRRRRADRPHLGRRQDAPLQEL